MKKEVVLTIALAAAYALLHGVAIDTNINYRQRAAALAASERRSKATTVRVSASSTLPIAADAAALRHIAFDRSRGKLNTNSFPDPMHPALGFALSAGALALAAWMVVGIVRAAIADHEAIAYAAQAALPAYLVALVVVLAACCALGNLPASVRLAVTDAAGRHTVAALGAVSAAVALAVIRIAIYRADEMHSANELAKEAARHPPANYT